MELGPEGSVSGRILDGTRCAALVFDCFVLSDFWHRGAGDLPEFKLTGQTCVERAAEHSATPSRHGYSTAHP